MKQFHKAIVNI